MIMKFGIASVALMLGLAGAQAQTNDDTIRQSLTEQGYTDIEISRDDGQLEVEAWRGEEKVEITYDLSTGNVIKSESERVTGGKAANDRDDLLDDQDDDDDLTDGDGDRDDADRDDDDRDNPDGRDDDDRDDGVGDDDGDRDPGGDRDGDRDDDRDDDDGDDDDGHDDDHGDGGDRDDDD